MFYSSLHDHVSVIRDGSAVKMHIYSLLCSWILENVFVNANFGPEKMQFISSKGFILNKRSKKKKKKTYVFNRQIHIYLFFFFSEI